MPIFHRGRVIALQRDSGGPGVFRGGLGIVREYEMLEGEMSFSHRGERHFSEAAGHQGGRPGTRAVSVITCADGTEEVIRSKLVPALSKSDRVLIQTAGGGGYGDPARRSRERLAEDVRNGKASVEAAEAEYGRAGS